MKGEFDRLITEARVVKTDMNTLELGWFHRLNYEIFSLFTNRYRLHKLFIIIIQLKGMNILY